MSDPALAYIRHVLSEKGWSVFELAKRAKVSHSTLNRPLTIADWPHRLSRNTITAVHRASGIDPSDFIGDAPVEAAEDARLVPVYDVEVSAGFGNVPAEFDVQVGQLAFPPDYLRRVANGAPVDRLAIVTVKGDSMAPTLRGGDVVLIDTTKTNLGFDGLFVLRMDGALHIKRVSRGSRSGMLRILSDNRDMYPPSERGIDEVEAVGKVLWYGRKE